MAPNGDDISPDMIPMSRILPQMVIRELRTHFYAGVKQAEVRFRFHAADEDSVTGALGQALAEPEPIIIQANGQAFLWRTTSYKLRGRGANAPETKYGADGIFQLEVTDQSGRFIVRKGLLFQSKIRWRGRNQRLLHQAQDLLEHSRSAIIIDYSDKGYKAIAASDVIAAEGNRKRINPEDDRTLAEVLGDEFVYCKRGDQGLYWEPERERLIMGGERVSELVPDEFIGTTIERLQ